VGRRAFIKILKDQKLIDLVAESVSKTEFKEKLKSLGANYSTEFVNLTIDRLQLDISHFSGRWKLPNQEDRYPIDTRLVKGKFRGGSALKKRLIKLDLLKPKCSCCGLTEWMNKPAPLELDHINGDPYDNQLHNLRILCANCHFQTSTSNGKNIKKKSGAP
jgi:hypothetical protein